MNTEEKVKYWVDKFNEKIDVDSVREFMDDIEGCKYKGNMFCPVCSAICYKHSVSCGIKHEKAREIHSIMFDLKYPTKNEGNE